MPVVFGVSGCANNTGNATYDCDGGDVVTITGANFTSNTSVYISWTRCNATLLSSTELSFPLPYMPVTSAVPFGVGVTNTRHYLA